MEPRRYDFQNIKTRNFCKAVTNNDDCNIKKYNWVQKQEQNEEQPTKLVS